jgi:hypothetical protein
MPEEFVYNATEERHRLSYASFLALLDLTDALVVADFNQAGWQSEIHLKHSRLTNHSKPDLERELSADAWEARPSWADCWCSCNDVSDASHFVRVWLRVFPAIIEIHITGSSRTDVEGIGVQLLEFVQEQPGQVETTAPVLPPWQPRTMLTPEANAQLEEVFRHDDELRSKAVASSAVTRPWYENPWLIAIGATVIGGGILAVVLSLI